MSILSKKTTIINIIRIIVAQSSFRREENKIKSTNLFLLRYKLFFYLILYKIFQNLCMTY